MTPTQKSLSLLRDLGYMSVDVTSYAHPKSGKFPVKRDLLGFADILAFKDGELLAVNATGRTNVNGHIVKYRENPFVKLWLKAGCHFAIHGWDHEDECRTVSAYVKDGVVEWEG